MTFCEEDLRTWSTLMKMHNDARAVKDMSGTYMPTLVFYNLCCDRDGTVEAALGWIKVPVARSRAAWATPAPVPLPRCADLAIVDDPTTGLPMPNVVSLMKGVPPAVPRITNLKSVWEEACTGTRTFFV